MVLPSYLPIQGGIETFVHNLTNKLNETGMQTDIMTFNMHSRWNPVWKEEMNKTDGFTVFRIAALNMFAKTGKDPIGHFFWINAFPKPNFICKLNSYDIIHFHDEGDLSFPLFSYISRRIKIFQCHGMESRFDFYKKNPVSKHVFTKSAQLFIAPSKSSKNLLMRLGLRESKIRIIPNGVDVVSFSPGHEKIENLVLYVGRIDEGKGLHILLKSLSFLKSSIHLIIIGPASKSPKSYNYEYCQKIMKLISEENGRMRHKVTYLGPMSQEDLVPWYQKASIFVCPSFMETFGIVNIEALSCETPVIASNVGGIPDVVNDHRNGILIPAGDARKLGDAIQFLLENEMVRKKYGRTGRNDVLKRFSFPVITKEFLTIYQEIFN